MLSIQLLALLPLLYSLACAHVVPRDTRSPFLNTTSPPTTLLLSPTVIPSPTGAPQKCCFLVQDIVNEAWWEQTAYQTEKTTITSMSYFVTRYPNTTVINVNSTVQTKTVISSHLVGRNPIALASNPAPGPAENTLLLTGTDAITTAGVTVPFPAAFYFYNSVRIITADAVLADGGNWMCGTTSSIFAPINSNAQAYFGPGPVAPSPTAFVKGRDTVTTTLGSSPSLVSPAATPADPTIAPTITSPVNVVSPEPTPTVLQLTEPFIYLPTAGAEGLKEGESQCQFGNSVEDYGFVPQTLLDYLGGNNYYADQYPWLKDCLIGGPTIVSQQSPCTLGGGGSGGGGGVTGTAVEPTTEAVTTATAIGGDLTEAVLIYVTPPGLSKPQPTKDTSASGGGDNTKGNDGNQNNGKGNDATTGGGQSTDGSGGSKNNPVDSQAQQNGAVDPSIGEIINSIINGPVDNSKNGGQSKPNSDSASDSSSNSASNPGSDNGGGNIQLINGKPYVLIPGPTNIPLSNAPAGIQGSTTVVDGKSYLAVPGPVTYATYANPQGTSAAGPASHGTTILIGGVPFVVYPGGKDIPLSEAQTAGITGAATKTINGTPYIALTDATTVPAVDPGRTSYGKTTLINNTPYLLLPTDTPLPASLFPTGLGRDAKTTSVDGKEFLIIASETRVPLPLGTDALKIAQLTVIMDGSSRLIIAGPTTMPVNSLFDIGGKTTVIDGTTMVVVTGATTAAAKKTSSSSSSSSPATRSPTVILPAPTQQAPKNGGERMRVEVCGVLLGLGVVVVGVFL